jgi:hypothetical protein
MGIVRVDTSFLDPALLAPDEDYLSYILQKRIRQTLNSNLSISDAYRPQLRRHRDKTMQSLRTFGRCAYLGDVPKQAIKTATAPRASIETIKEIPFETKHRFIHSLFEAPAIGQNVEAR